MRRASLLTACGLLVLGPPTGSGQAPKADPKIVVAPAEALDK